MSKNSFGNIITYTTFGESHGIALGVVIDQFPAGVDVDLPLLQSELDRRKPGSSPWVSGRQEPDTCEILSGVFEGKTLGTPIAVIVRNQDAKSEDYDKVKTQPRAGHADDVWKNKFGVSDYRGGGRSSGRETLARVIAGAFSKMLLQKLQPQLQVRAYSQQVAHFILTAAEEKQFLSRQNSASDFVAGFVSATRAKDVGDFLVQAKALGESYGGRVAIVVQGVPAGLGQPIFHKLKSDLAMGLMSLGATAGFELGDTNQALDQPGTKFHAGNPYGGIRGGISTGEDLVMSVILKPTSSILDVAKKGRHDPCILPRAIPVIESIVSWIVADHLLWSRLDRV